MNYVTLLRPSQLCHILLATFLGILRMGSVTSTWHSMARPDTMSWCLERKKNDGNLLSPMCGIYGLIVYLTVLVTLHCDKTPSRTPKRGVGLFKLVISKRTAYYGGNDTAALTVVVKTPPILVDSTRRTQTRPRSRYPFGGLPPESHFRELGHCSKISTASQNSTTLQGANCSTLEPEGAVCTFKTWCLSLVPIGSWP